MISLNICFDQITTSKIISHVHIQVESIDSTFHSFRKKAIGTLSN